MACRRRRFVSGLLPFGVAHPPCREQALGPGLCLSFCVNRRPSIHHDITRIDACNAAHLEHLGSRFFSLPLEHTHNKRETLHLVTRSRSQKKNLDIKRIYFAEADADR